METHEDYKEIINDEADNLAQTLAKSLLELLNAEQYLSSSKGFLEEQGYKQLPIYKAVISNHELVTSITDEIQTVLSDLIGTKYGVIS